MKIAIVSVLNRLPRLKRMFKSVRNRFFPGADVSSHYVSLQAGEASAEGRRLRAAWQNNVLPQKQRELVDRQLRQYRAGEHVDVFDVFTNSLRALPDFVPGMSLLEIGCSSGFYSEVLEIAGLDVIYAGCDYSNAFIQLARQKYPALRFDVEDATALKYGNETFDIVISGCCLLHIPEYQVAVVETVRVARRYVVFHRTPVVWGQPEQWYRKQAYGVETVEIHFNEPQFLKLLELHGLELIATYTLGESAQRGVGSATRTYVCRKIPR